MPEDFHKHWYWDRYSEPSELILDPLRVITHTTSTKRLPSAFEATEPRERLCGQCRLPGHTRNSMRCIHNIRRLNQELQTDQLTIPPNSSNRRDLHTNSQSEAIVQAAIQELEVSPLESQAIQEDTRPIWPGRIELIYQAYLAEKSSWLAANPTVQSAQYRKKKGLKSWTKADCTHYSIRWLLPQQCLDLESESLIEGQPNWTREEIHAWLDWDEQQEKNIEEQVEAEIVATGGFRGDSRRGIGHIHRQIDADDIAERRQYRFRD